MIVLTFAYDRLIIFRLCETFRFDLHRITVQTFGDHSLFARTLLGVLVFAPFALVFRAGDLRRLHTPASLGP